MNVGRNNSSIDEQLLFFHKIMSNNLHSKCRSVSSEYVLQFTLIADLVDVDALYPIENYPSSFNTDRSYSVDAIKLRLLNVDA